MLLLPLQKSDRLRKLADVFPITSKQASFWHDNHVEPGTNIKHSYNKHCARQLLGELVVKHMWLKDIHCTMAQAVCKKCFCPDLNTGMSS